MRDFVIIGTGDFADIVHYIITRRMKRNVIFFVVDDVYYQTNQLSHGVPVVSMSQFLRKISPEECTIAIGYIGKHMFDDREEKFRFLSEKGFSFDNILDIENEECCSIGSGNIIMKNVVLGYGVMVGTGNIIWPGAVMPHHNVVGNFNNIAPTVSLSGFSEIGNHCYIGNNSVIKNHVKVADYSLIGAGAYLTKDTSQDQVVVPNRSYVLENKTSRDFY